MEETKKEKAAVKPHFTKRATDTKKALIRRFNVAEGQMRGIKQMIEDDRYTEDILIQVLAVEKALETIGKEVLRAHISSESIPELVQGNLETVDEMMMLFDKLK